jgi:WG containing repeat
VRDKEGLIDKSGRVILAPRYDEIFPFSEGFAPARLDGRWGFIDKAGKLVIPIKFDSAWVFHSGLAAVKKSKWGFIDKTGAFVIAPRFDEITYNNPEPFEKGVAKVKTYDGWGCITRTGEGIECPAQ